MKKLLFILLLLPFCFSSCQKSEAERLMNGIETYIQTRPDSALAVLSQIDTSSLRHSKERAQFALLYAIALDKNDIDTTIFSGIIMCSKRKKRIPSRLRSTTIWLGITRLII